MIHIKARLDVKPDQLETFLELSKPLIAASVAEAGNISYELAQVVGNTHAFYFLEKWKDEDAIATHNETAHFKAFSTKIDSLFEKQPEVILLTQISK